MQNCDDVNCERMTKGCTRTGALVPGLVVMGGDSCSRGRGFDPSTGYWMDIFIKNLLFVRLFE